LIELSASLSNRILRKGDVFNIYVDIHNISDKPINIEDVQLVSPLGFIQYKNDMPMKLWDRVKGVQIGLTSFKFSAADLQVSAAPFKIEVEKNPSHDE
jgi:hypothetical protein